MSNDEKKTETAPQVVLTKTETAPQVVLVGCPHKCLAPPMPPELVSAHCTAVCPLQPVLCPWTNVLGLAPSERKHEHQCTGTVVRYRLVEHEAMCALSHLVQLRTAFQVLREVVVERTWRDYINKRVSIFVPARMLHATSFSSFSKKERRRPSVLGPDYTERHATVRLEADGQRFVLHYADEWLPHHETIAVQDFVMRQPELLPSPSSSSSSSSSAPLS